MKTINETFSDDEHEKLSKKKGKMSWHDFILYCADENGDEINEV